MLISYQVYFRIDGNEKRCPKYIRASSDRDAWKQAHRLLKRRKLTGRIDEIRRLLWITKFRDVLVDRAMKGEVDPDSESISKRLRRLKNGLDFQFSEIKRACPESTLGCFIHNLSIVTYRRVL